MMNHLNRWQQWTWIWIWGWLIALSGATELTLIPIQEQTDSVSGQLRWVERSVADDAVQPSVLYRGSSRRSLQKLIFGAVIRDEEGVIRREVRDSAFWDVLVNQRSLRVGEFDHSVLAVEPAYFGNQGPALAIVINRSPSLQLAASGIAGELDRLLTNWQEDGMEPELYLVHYGLGFLQAESTEGASARDHRSPLWRSDPPNRIELSANGSVQAQQAETIPALQDALEWLTARSDNPRRALIWITDGLDVDTVGAERIAEAFNLVWTQSPLHAEIQLYLEPRGWRDAVRLDSLALVRQHMGTGTPWQQAAQGLDADTLRVALAPHYWVQFETRNAQFLPMDGAEHEVSLGAHVAGAPVYSSPQTIFTVVAGTPIWLIAMILGVVLLIGGLVGVAIMMRQITEKREQKDPLGAVLGEGDAGAAGDDLVQQILKSRNQ